MLDRLRRLPQGVEDGRTFDCHGRLLMTWKMCKRWFVETRARIDIDRVDYFICGL